MMTRFSRGGLVAALLALIAVLASLGADPAGAQSTPPPATSGQAAPQPASPAKSFLPPRAATPAGTTKVEAAAAPPSGILAGLYFWMADKQRQFISRLAAALRDIKSGNAFAASLVLIGFSFAYGILHAAGPGHGKAVVSSYILADGQTVRRSVQLAFLSSFVQALSAILIFSIVMFVIGQAQGAISPRAQIATTEAWIERASWAIVAAFGAWLLIRQIRALITGKPAHDHAHHAGPQGGHGHHGHAHHDHSHEGIRHLAHDAHAHHDHKHNHGHAHTHSHNHGPGEACATCGHAHMPEAKALQGTWSWKRAGGMAVAIGMRPCTGAIGVLFVANGLGLLWAGIVSTFMMAVGTAITVSTLAALAASSRDAAAKLAGVADNRWAARAQMGFGLVGAALVFLLGSTFFYYSLSTTTPF